MVEWFALAVAILSLSITLLFQLGPRYQKWEAAQLILREFTPENRTYYDGVEQDFAYFRSLRNWLFRPGTPGKFEWFKLNLPGSLEMYLDRTQQDLEQEIVKIENAKSVFKERGTQPKVGILQDGSIVDDGGTKTEIGKKGVLVWQPEGAIFFLFGEEVSVKQAREAIEQSLEDGSKSSE